MFEYDYQYIYNIENVFRSAILYNIKDFIILIINIRIINNN